MQSDKKTADAYAPAVFDVRILLSGADGAIGAGVAARTAVQAGIGVDHILRIALGDSAHGASICASAAADASGTDLISHFEYLH